MDQLNVEFNEVIQIQDAMADARATYKAFGRFIRCVIGDGNSLNNFECTPSTPPALTVELAAGELYTFQPLDAAQYDSFSIDSTDLMKQAIYRTPETLALPNPPVTVGNSKKYLIEVGYQQVYGDVENRAFKGASSQNVNTMRIDQALVNVLEGTEAPTGTEVTPTPNAGFEGMWVITVAFGQTTVTAPDISVYPNAPFILEKLQNKISSATGDARYTLKPNIAATPYFVEGNGTLQAFNTSFQALPLTQTDGQPWISANTITIPYDGYVTGTVTMNYTRDQNNQKVGFWFQVNGLGLLDGVSTLADAGEDTDFVSLDKYLLAGDTLQVVGRTAGGTASAQITILSLSIIPG